MGRIRFLCRSAFHDDALTLHPLAGSWSWTAARIVVLVQGAGLLFLLTGGLATAAQAVYPERSVALIVPYPAGGRTDLIGRLLADHLHQHLKQPVVILNVAGAGGTVGAKEVARAKADGYVLGLFSTGFLVTQYTTAGAPPLASFEPVAKINLDPAVLAVRADSSYSRLGDLIAGQHRRSVRLGVTFGASSHLFAAALARATGITVSYIPFRGDPESLTALVGGHIDGAVTVPGVVRPWLQQGSLRVLAISTETPLAAYAGIPTFRAEGVDLVMGSWHGVFAPRGTPQPVLEILAGAFERVTAEAAFLDKTARLPTSIGFRRPPEFVKFLREEDEHVKHLVETLGLALSPVRPGEPSPGPRPR